MARRSQRTINMPPPYLKRVWLKNDVADEGMRDQYPFNLPLLKPDFEIAFEKPVTIFVGENGVGKSTLIEAVASLAGYDDAGGGKGYRPVDHERALERSGGELAKALRAAWLPKITSGWFFKAETFFSVARYLDEAARDDVFGPPPPDFLSHSHGEGFLRFFEERCDRQGIYFFDEPESALSPRRQIEFLKIIARMEQSNTCQVIMATHSPLLMAYPDANLMRITRDGIARTTLAETDHFRLMREFCADPKGFVREQLDQA